MSNYIINSKFLNSFSNSFVSLFNINKPVDDDSNLLLEDSSNLLLEDGFKILLENKNG